MAGAGCSEAGRGVRGIHVWDKLKLKKKKVEDGTAGNPQLIFGKDDVYLVTHDRILLSFALLLGIKAVEKIFEIIKK